MKSKNLLSTVLTPILILKTLSAVASAYDDCPIEFDPETQSAGDPLSYRIDNVLANDKSAFLFFHSGWCPYCHQQMPTVDRLEDEYVGLVTFIRINVTARPDHAKEFGVSALPTMIIIRGTDEDGHLREEPSNNIGTVNTTGTAVIRVLNSTGDVVDEFRHNVTNPTPAESVSFSDTWDTPGAEAGSSYKIIDYVLHDSKSTDPAIVTVRNPIMGDLNLDGVVTTADAAIALELAASGEYDPAADVDCDGQITALDALMIVREAAGNIELEGGES